MSNAVIPNAIRSYQYHNKRRRNKLTLLVCLFSIRFKKNHQNKISGQQNNRTTEYSVTMNTDFSLPSSEAQPRTVPCSSINVSRKPPMLYPSPGVLPGSRKRRVFSRHGPFSSSMDADLSHVEEGPPDDVVAAQSSAKITPVLSLMDAPEAERSPSRMSNCSSPITPKGPNKEIKDTIAGSDLAESPYRTPANRNIRSSSSGGHLSITMSPTTSEMQMFQHLSIRSPRLSKSPGSSFSQYTRSVMSANASACGVTVNTPITSQGSFDGTDTNMSVPNQYTNRVKTVPLTIISNKFSSYQGKSCEHPTPTSNEGSTSEVTTMNDTMANKPSRYLTCPVPKSVSSPSRRNRNFCNNTEGTENSHGSPSIKDAVVVSVEKPAPHYTRCRYEGISPMITLSPFDEPASSHSTRMVSGSPPPITFLSMGEEGINKNKKKGGQDNGAGWGLKRKSSITMSTSRSLFKPASTASNDALDEMLYEGDTDGSLSDSDDEGGDNGFFLSDPSCLSSLTAPALPPRGLLSSILKPNNRCNSNNTNIDQSEGSGFGLSLTAAYSLKTKKKKVNSGDNPIFPNLPTSFDRKYTNQNHTLMNDDACEQNREGSTSESNTSLFGMNIIHENSISNGSLADIGIFPSTKRNSCRSFNEDHTSSASFLNRSKSDQSINSIGLCIDSCSGVNKEYNGRDMVTPPVNSRTMSSPPPLKQTRLSVNSS